MNEIFLSYRRADERGTTGRLFDHLVQAFGEKAVFYDVDKIPHGENFREFIEKTIRNCRVVLVVIGPLWLDMKSEKARRLDEVNDPVRIEIEAALLYNKRIIPVLIDEARMPTAASLPPTLERLAPQNAAPMHNNQYFEQDINTLINDIAGMGIPRKTPGFIVNPPVAGLPTLTRRQTAAIVGIPLLFIALGVAALGVGYLAFQFIGRPATNGAHPTLTHFCSALAANDVGTAYTDLTPAFQTRIGSASNLPTKLTADFFGNQVTVIGCHPSVQSGPDGFYHENGNTANDDVDFEAVKANGTAETVESLMYFSKEGGVWLIDRVQNS